MKLRNMFLCDAASYHPDNTFSVLRGGVSNINIPFKNIDLSKPQTIPPIKLALVATIDLEITEMGRLHSLELAILDADGQRIIPDLKSNFQPAASPKKGRHNIVLNMLMQFRKAGDYGIYLNVDSNELGYHPFSVTDVSTSA